MAVPALAMVVIGSVTPAAAQSHFETTSYSNTETVTVITNSTLRNDSYQTRITGGLANGTLLYDQIFLEAFGGAGPQSGVAAARLAITTGGAPGIVVLGPSRVQRTVTVNSTLDIQQTSSTSQQVTIEDTVGPATILINDRGPDGTGGDPFTISAGQTSTNYHFDIHTDTTETRTTTENWLTYEHWALTGVVQGVGFVHTAVRSGAYDATSRFLRRMGDEAARPPTGERLDGWAEFYGTTARTHADGIAPGDRRRSYGFATGFVIAAAENLTLGFGLDLDSAFAETGTLDLTEIGVDAGFRSGRWFANLAATCGFGDADTMHAVGGVSTAGYDLRTWGLLAETGYRLDLGPVRLTPSLGLDHVDLHTDGFAETGGAALLAPSHSSSRSRAWLGLDLARTWETATGGAFGVSGYGRVVGVLSGEERFLPVAFAAAPGAPLRITGNAEDRIGVDFGAKAVYALGNGASVYAAYDRLFRDGLDAHQVLVGFRMRW